MAPIVFNLKQIIRNVGNFTTLPFVGLYSASTLSTPTTSESVSTSVAFATATSVFTPTVFEPSDFITATATTPVIEEVSTSIFPTVITSIPVDEEGNNTFIGVGDVFKAKDLGVWVYVLLAIVLFILTGLSFLFIYKCCNIGVNRTPRCARNQSSLKRLEEGRGRKWGQGIKLKGLGLDEDSLRKERNKRRDSDRYGYGFGKMVESQSEREERERWELIKNRLSSQSQRQYEQMYEEGVLQLKAANGTLGITLESTSGESPCSLTVPRRVLLKDTRVLFPPGLDAFDIPYATPDKRWRNPKLSPIRGAIIPLEVVLYR